MTDPDAYRTKREWISATVPAAKGGGTYDMYTFTCIKTANASWLCFGNANTF